MNNDGRYLPERLKSLAAVERLVSRAFLLSLFWRHIRIWCAEPDWWLRCQRLLEFDHARHYDRKDPCTVGRDVEILLGVFNEIVDAWNVQPLGRAKHAVQFDEVDFPIAPLVFKQVISIVNWEAFTLATAILAKEEI